MPVRPATPADLDHICALITELAAYERLEDDVAFDRDEMAVALFGPDPVAHVVMAEVAEPNGSIPAVAGFALWFRTFSTFLGKSGIWLEDLFVRPDYRGEGLGRELLAYLRNLTDGRLEWSVLDWNEPALAFYRHLGAAPLDGWTTYRWLPPPPA
jgi:GNAT superfamily N-acetyltransferase